MNAIVDARNDKIVGYHKTFSNQRSQMAKKPVLCPKASFTQINTPPDLGHPVASSAETREMGRIRVNKRW